ncbi:hypothetical protein GOODEAATRI_011150, partial [Goodea atripinnis]
TRWEARLRADPENDVGRSQGNNPLRRGGLPARWFSGLHVDSWLYRMVKVRVHVLLQRWRDSVGVITTRLEVVITDVSMGSSVAVQVHLGTVGSSAEVSAYECHGAAAHLLGAEALLVISQMQACASLYGQYLSSNPCQPLKMDQITARGLPLGLPPSGQCTYQA